MRTARTCELSRSRVTVSACNVGSKKSTSADTLSRKLEMFCRTEQLVARRMLVVRAGHHTFAGEMLSCRDANQIFTMAVFRISILPVMAVTIPLCPACGCLIGVFKALDLLMVHAELFMV